MTATVRSITPDGGDTTVDLTMALQASVYREALRQLIDAAETYTRNPDTGRALSSFYDALDKAEKALEAQA